MKEKRYILARARHDRVNKKMRFSKLGKSYDQLNHAIMQALKLAPAQQGAYVLITDGMSKSFGTVRRLSRNVSTAIDEPCMFGKTELLLPDQWMRVLLAGVTDSPTLSGEVFPLTEE